MEAKSYVCWTISNLIFCEKSSLQSGVLQNIENLEFFLYVIVETRYHKKFANRKNLVGIRWQQ